MPGRKINTGGDPILVQGVALTIAGCAINYIPVRVHRTKDAVRLILSILSLLGCWFGFSLIVGPSLFQYSLDQPLLFVTGLALLGWSFRIIIRGLQVGKVIPLIAGFIGVFPAVTWIETGAPVLSEAWISLVYGLAALIAANGINHFVRFSLGYAKTKQIYILHIVYGIVSVGLAAASVGYAATQSDLYLNTATILMAVGVGYFLFVKGYQLYRNFKNRPEMTEEERERIRREFFSPIKN